MVSSGRSNPTASQQMANIANNKQNQNQSAQKARDYYNSITKTTDAYINQPITVNSAADAKNAEVNRKRNEQLADIKKQADAIMNDSSLSAKEKAFQLGSLNSSTYGTISKAYADTNNMNAALNVSDAIQSVVSVNSSVLNPFNNTNNTTTSPQKTTSVTTHSSVQAGSTPDSVINTYAKNGYINYGGNSISVEEFKEGTVRADQDRILQQADYEKWLNQPGHNRSLSTEQWMADKAWQDSHLGVNDHNIVIR